MTAARRFIDPSSGRPYYHDPVTGRTWWDDDQPKAAAPAYFAESTTRRTTTRSSGGKGWLWLIPGLLVGFVAGIGVSGSDGTETVETAAAGTSAAPAAAKKKPVADASTVVVIKNPKTFGDAFDKNQVAAEKQWGGKRVQLTAPVSNVTDGQVTLDGVTTDEYSFTQVACDLKDDAQALTVENGKPATVVGTVDGQTIGVITLKDCVIK